ncbi:MAG: VCBS repeat-containing protein [SAR324 cluster bacterium]|nr:VCBS repeat-containing protein [SAR324 cluster bacterium]
MFSAIGCVKGTADFDEEAPKPIQESESIEVVTTTTTTTTTVSQTVSSSLGTMIDSIEAQYSVSTGATLNSPIKIKFNRTMDVSSVNSAVSMNVESKVIELSPLTGGQTADTFLFQPAELLQLATNYAIIVSTAAMDRQGNSLSESAAAVITTRSIDIYLSPDNTGMFKIGTTLCCATTINSNFLINTDDLVISADGNIYRYQNNGSGSFSSLGFKSSETTAPFTAVVSGDVDRDGLDDIVFTVDRGNDAVHVASVLNQMDLTSSNPFTWTDTDSIYTVASTMNDISRLSSELVSIDVNNDGNMDLLIADVDVNQPSVLVLGGAGGGQFAISEKLSLATSIIPAGMAATDFDRDGDQDIVVASATGKNMVLFEGNGFGTFIQTSTIALSNMSPNHVVAADFDGDNDPDFVFSDIANNQIVFLLNEGNASFKLLNQITVGQSPGALVSRDFNGDGLFDIVVVNEDDNEITILLGNGNGGFAKKESLATAESPKQLLVANLNDDSIDDLVVTSAGDVGFFFGTGNGAFSAMSNMAVGNSPSASAVIDINGDSILDVIVSNQNDDDLSLLIGNGKGGFSRQSDLSLATSSSPVDIIVGDFDNDQQKEVVTLNKDDDTIAFLNVSGGQLQSTFTVVLTGDTPQGGVAGDFNNDGYLDIAIAMTGSNQLNILLNSGGGFSALNQSLTTTPTKPVALATGHFNSDDNLDMAVVNQSDKTVSIFFGTGTGQFASAQTLDPTAVQATGILTDVALIEQSGRVTALAVTDYSARSVLLYTNDGGTFSYSSTLSVISPPDHVVAEDLNGDQVPELIVTATNFLFIFSDTGSQTYTASRRAFNLGINPKSPIIADFDGDLAPDIGIADQHNNEFSILLQR